LTPWLQNDYITKSAGGGLTTYANLRLAVTTYAGGLGEHVTCRWTRSAKN